MGFEFEDKRSVFSEDFNRGTMIVTGVADELESGIKIRSEVFSDVYDVQSEVGRYI